MSAVSHTIPALAICLFDILGALSYANGIMNLFYADGVRFNCIYQLSTHFHGQFSRCSLFSVIVHSISTIRHSAWLLEKYAPISALRRSKTVNTIACTTAEIEYILSEYDHTYPNSMLVSKHLCTMPYCGD